MAENQKKEVRPVRVLKNNLPPAPKKGRVISRREKLNRVIRMLKSAATELEFERDALPQHE